MNQFFKKIICLSLISLYFLKVEQVLSLVPYYYFPTIKNLQKESLTIVKNAYQLLYFGQYEQSLNVNSLNWDDQTWNENLKGTTLKRIKPWMWKRNIEANLKNNKIKL